MDTLRGRLLIASPALHDPNFRRTVVLVVEHNEEGAMGLVLNRATEATVADAVPPLADVVPAGARVHLGGPISPESVVVLGEFADHDAAGPFVFGDVGFMPGDADPVLVGAAARRLRVFAGYAGWSPGQLETELAEPSWLVEPALVEDVFEDGDTWARVLRRKGGPYRLLASMPEDPALN